MPIEMDLMVVPLKDGDRDRSIFRWGEITSYIVRRHRLTLKHEVILTVCHRNLKVSEVRLGLTQVKHILNLTGIGENTELHKLKDVLLTRSLRLRHCRPGLHNHVGIVLKVSTLELDHIELTIATIEPHDTASVVVLRDTLEDE